MTKAESVILVLLRQPNRANVNEKRSDPFWEFGSFGRTGCHGRTLLGKRVAATLTGHRLGFVQGGPEGFRLVFLTPPIDSVRSYLGGGNRVHETLWSPPAWPFRYSAAPLIINNQGQTDFPRIRALISSVKRSTPVSQFASKFRTRCTPLSALESREICDTYAALRANAQDRLATSYEQALPYPPNVVDRDRRRSFEELTQFLKLG
jgi:hypothetical protein